MLEVHDGCTARQRWHVLADERQHDVARPTKKKGGPRGERTGERGELMRGMELFPLNLWTHKRGL